MPALLKSLVFCCLTAAGLYSVSPAAETDFLLAGVKEIAAPGEPGTLAVFGTGAFAVVAGKFGDEDAAVAATVVAAANFGKGRLVAFGHPSYFDGDALAVADTGKLLVNAIRWSAKVAADKPAGKIRVGTVGETSHPYLVAQGFDVRRVSLRKTVEADVLLLTHDDVDDKNVAALQGYVRNGGGIVVAGIGWGWLQLNPAKNLASDYALNRLCLPMGVVWADGIAARTSRRGYGVRLPLPVTLNAATAFAALTNLAPGPRNPVPQKELRQISATLALAVQSLPPSEDTLLPRIRRIVMDLGERTIPTPAHPITLQDPLARVAATISTQEVQRCPPDKVVAHSAAKSFPGDVPADAKPVAKTFSIDTRVPLWHGTGLYAPPGARLLVQIPASSAGKGLAVRIGCHTDENWSCDDWSRLPAISRSFVLDGPLTIAANAFGGLVYVEVPDECKLGVVTVTIRGAIEAPRFVLGETSRDEWNKHLINLPGPWAELETKKVILSLPSAQIRKLDDPAALLQVWDRILDADADLAALPHDRKAPERIVPDVQISCGYMHSGYPIMTEADQYGILADRKAILAGQWGLFHELGHNHQSDDWTFDGAVEVTVNLFSLYVMETVCGKTPGEGHDDDCKPETIARRMRAHIAAGSPFAAWQDDPFLALTMYVQLRHAFGWDAYKRVFAEYRGLSPQQRPKNEQEKRDQWMVRFSRTVGYNLGPFFEAWGVPTSAVARQSVAKLPLWMPAGMKEAIDARRAGKAKTSRT